jgi:hypothetical protein
MKSLSARRLALGLACLIGLAPLLAAGPKGGDKPADFTGKVVSLADLVARSGGKLDADAAPHWLALVKDDGSRLFFKDKALLNRPMRLTGRLVPGSQLLRVNAVKSIHKGALHEVYYWCEICSIKRGEKNLCECCGGPMELREEPLGR